MYDTIVALDLETTGADPYTDRIIEVGAVRIEGGQVVDSFNELCATDRVLSPTIIKLTGIEPSMLEGCRALDAVLADFLEWLPDADTLCIAHNAAFDRGFLRAATKDRFQHRVLDTVGLARICFPELPSHGLGYLVEALGIEQDATHRALADCGALADLWQKILVRARTIPLPVVHAMNELIAPHRTHPFRDFFRRLEEDVSSREYGGELSIEKYFRLKRRGPRPKPLDPDGEGPDEEASIDCDAIGDIFSPGGLLDDALDTFESRPGQVEMARSVSSAYNTRRHLVVEAGTGIGKSMAYLVPSVIWAVTHDAPIVVSTNTRNLQSQLYHKDLPLLEKALGLPFRRALLKGRGNYLCHRRLMQVVRFAHHELDHEERMRMLNILPWAAWSSSGDIAENTVAERPGFHHLWAKLSAASGECTEKACRGWNCPLHQARAEARAAHIVVANHALVFSEINATNPALPPYRQLVFDEAHNLENAATGHLSTEVGQNRFSVPLGRLWRKGRRNTKSGLLMALAAELEKAEGEAEVVDRAQAGVQDLIEAIGCVDGPLKAFQERLRATLQAPGGRSGESRRFEQGRKVTSLWEPIHVAQENLLAVVGRVIQGLEDLAEDLKTLGGPAREERARTLLLWVDWLRDATEDAAFVLAGDDERYVFWTERAPNSDGGVRAVAAPKLVGPLLADQLYNRKDSVIFSSATLTVRDRFDFLSRRIGIDRVDPERVMQLNAGTPFDYPRQCRILVPMFLPEPGDKNRDFKAELAVLFSEMCRRSRGRALGLFTSYDMLRGVADRMQQELLGDGLRLLAQGMSGSRENITSLFKSDIHSVLLGTHSFWEGVDVVGEALSCLLIARLPFPVFTDPIVEARCEQVEAEGENPFMAYSLPTACIRFRQGFGRLIRSIHDRGLVVVADRRILAKRYGSWFEDSLPASVEGMADREAFLDEIEDFFAEE